MRRTGIELNHISKSFGKGDARVQALDDVSLVFAPGSFTAIMGRSGCGKTTLLRLLGGLDKPDTGSICVAGKEITRMTEEELCALRREQTGYIFQDLNLFDELSLEDNIRLPYDLQDLSVPETELEDLLDQMDLQEQRHRLPQQVSGGQRQKAAIARALLCHLPVLLADEPTGSLDRRSAEAFLDVLCQARVRYRPTIILVTHDEQTAMRADRIVRLEDGKVVADD